MHENLSNTLTAVISRLRRLAAKQGLALQKSRCRNLHVGDCGGYMIFDASTNYVRAGDRYDLSVNEVSDFLSSQGED